MGKQVRSFYIDHEIGLAIDMEADSVGPNKKSEVVNELLREALERRFRTRVSKKVMATVEGSAISSLLFVFVWIALVLL